MFFSIATINWLNHRYSIVERRGRHPGVDTNLANWYRLREPRSVKGPRAVARYAHDRDREQVVGAGSRMARER